MTVSPLHTLLMCQTMDVERALGLPGIGPKTIDYFKILCGEQDTAAVDVHLLQFFEQAGVRLSDCAQAREIVVRVFGRRIRWASPPPRLTTAYGRSCRSQSRDPPRVLRRPIDVDAPVVFSGPAAVGFASAAGGEGLHSAHFCRPLMTP